MKCAAVLLWNISQGSTFHRWFQTHFQSNCFTHKTMQHPHESRSIARIGVNFHSACVRARSLALTVSLILSPRRPALILICYWDISFINSNDQYRLQKIENIPIKTALKPIPPRIFLLYKMDRERE